MDDEDDESGGVDLRDVVFDRTSFSGDDWSDFVPPLMADGSDVPEMCVFA